MKNFISMTLVSAVITLSASAWAKPASKIDYINPDDMSAQCAAAIIKKLSADSEVGQFMENPYLVSLDWYDEAHTQASFEIKFDEDIRDGYVVGEINIKVKSNNSCKAGTITNYSQGD